MRCGVDFDEVWIMRGGTDSIESYDYSGFRYVEMTCDDASVRPEQVSVVVRHYPAPRKRIFTSEKSLLQNIWSICENAVIMGTQEGFYDCPTREKAQYLGDMLITGFSVIRYPLFRKAFRSRDRFSGNSFAVFVPENFPPVSFAETLLRQRLALYIVILPFRARFVNLSLSVSG